jgi:hypothetical protein
MRRVKAKRYDGMQKVNSGAKGVKYLEVIRPFPTSPMHATIPSHITVLDLITLITTKG